jgi:hypothetical protein
MKYFSLNGPVAIQRPGFIELVVVHSNSPRVNERPTASRNSTRSHNSNILDTSASEPDNLARACCKSELNWLGNFNREV